MVNEERGDLFFLLSPYFFPPSMFWTIFYRICSFGHCLEFIFLFFSISNLCKIKNSVSFDVSIGSAVISLSAYRV